MMRLPSKSTIDPRVGRHFSKADLSHSEFVTRQDNRMLQENSQIECPEFILMMEELLHQLIFTMFYLSQLVCNRSSFHFFVVKIESAVLQQFTQVVDNHSVV